jgi:hypothetical protein
MWMRFGRKHLVFIIIHHKRKGIEWRCYLNVHERYDADRNEVLDEHQHIAKHKHLVLAQIDVLTKGLCDVDYLRVVVFCYARMNNSSVL